MKFFAFSSRNQKELLRDPINLLFGIGLPLVLLFLISTIQRSLPQVPDIFKIQNFTPGIAMFSLSFITLFGGVLLANDRCSSFLARLFATPLTATDYIVGYSLPLLPLALVQSFICFLAAFFLGLPVNFGLLSAILALVPVAILFIALGLLLGSLFSNKQVPPICSIVIQVVAFSSGMWFDLNMIGGIFKTVSYVLPFAHAVDLVKGALAMSDFTSLLPHLLWVFGYALVIFMLAVVVFRDKMKG